MSETNREALAWMEEFRPNWKLIGRKVIFH